MRRVSVLSSAQMEFGIIPHDHWYAPPWIDEQKATDARKKMEEDNVIYGGTSYRVGIGSIARPLVHFI